MIYDSIDDLHHIDIFMGKPKSGKTLIAGTYPKPMLYISVGNDGGGRVLKTAFAKDIANGNIKFKNITNDLPVGGKINKTSVEKLAEILAELRKPGADHFETIVIDTMGAVQDDYKSYLEFTKGKQLSQQEWGDVAQKVLAIKDNLKRFSAEKQTIIVMIFHTSEQELTETSGLNKEIRIIPDLTIKSGVKYLKDASNVFYCCRKTILTSKGDKDVKFLTYVGPHPLMDTGTRDMLLPHGEFVENFSYSKFQDMINKQIVSGANIYVPDDTENKDTKKGE